MWQKVSVAIQPYLKYLVIAHMVAAPSPNFRGDLKISDQNNWGGGGWGPEQKIKFGGT